MKVPILLFDGLAAHRRSRILQEAVAAVQSSILPKDSAIILEFGDTFQAAGKEVRSRILEWTKSPGHLFLLLPPFAPSPCEIPVSWQAELLTMPPRGGKGLAEVLSPEVNYRLTGSLTAPDMPRGTWNDLSLSLGIYRAHPAAGVFAVTTLPLWSLSVLDAGDELEIWLSDLFLLAGESMLSEEPSVSPLSNEHYGLLVYLLSQPHSDEERAINDLRNSPIFHFSAERGRSLLKDLQVRGLINGSTPTNQAEDLIMNSQYAHYVKALREVNRT